MFVVSEKWVETRTDCYINPAVLLSHLGRVTQPWVTEGPKPFVWSWFSLRHPHSNWLEPSGHLVILLSNGHLLPLVFRLFTQVHLLIDGSVEGQYITSLPHTHTHAHTHTHSYIYVYIYMCVCVCVCVCVKIALTWRQRHLVTVSFSPIRSWNQVTSRETDSYQAPLLWCLRYPNLDTCSITNAEHCLFTNT